MRSRGRGSSLGIVLALIGIVVLLCLVVFVLSSGSRDENPSDDTDDSTVTVTHGNRASRLSSRAPSVPTPAKTPGVSPRSELATLAGVPLLTIDTCPLTLPARTSVPLPADLQALVRQAQASQQAGDWRRLADRAVQQRFHTVAADAYRHEASIYRTSDPQAAEAETMKAESHTASMTVCYVRASTPSPAPGLARLEPRRGCYIGAFIDRDDRVAGPLQDGQMHGDIQAFKALMGRPHASYFTYLSYGRPFPSQWVASLKAEGAIPHIAWEPGNLEEVQDDDYLKGFVQEAKDADCPLFIRFAGEMNGDWTPYHADPKAYVQAFRTVFTAFRRAPRAALIWCPNAIPRANIDEYYPGDAYTDWVGVNLYSVLYIDDDPKKPGDAIHPTDLLDPVYARYSLHKPIAIGEYAASHQSHRDKAPLPDFAIRRLDELYQALPTRYPRVKMVNWYDCDNMKHARPGRRLNNYLLTDIDRIRTAYQNATSTAWYLRSSLDGQEQPPASPIEYVPLSDGAELGPDVVVQVSVRCWTPTPRVYFEWDHRVLHATDDPAASSLHISGAAPGPHVLHVAVLDADSRLIVEQTYRIAVR